jgi:hypothetical protein
MACLAAALGCSQEASADNLGDREEASRTGDPCVVARGEGFELTIRDVEALRRHFVPPPPMDRAGRLALDVWLAEWIATGTIDRAPLPERISHHNALVNRDLEERIAHLDDARARLQVSEGPCWVSAAKRVGEE